MIFTAHGSILLYHKCNNLPYLSVFSYELLEEGASMIVGIGRTGWLRASIEPGDITLEDIQSVFANPTVLYYETYTGQQVLDMVNSGLSTVYPEEEGQPFLQYSGVEVTYTYNPGGTGTPVTINNECFIRMAMIIYILLLSLSMI